jgi:hypothetical protein
MRSSAEGDWCSECPDPVKDVATFHDVYFDKPGTHHGICDPSTGEEIFITSRAHKAYEMKKLGLEEKGDPVGGKRNFDPISYRHAQESLRRNP